MEPPVQLKLNLVLPLDDTLDTFTAARIAKVTESSVRRWCEEGRVHAWKPVGRWRVCRTSLYALINKSNNNPSALIPPSIPPQNASLK